MPTTQTKTRTTAGFVERRIEAPLLLAHAWIANGRILPDLPLPHRPGSLRRTRLATGHYRARHGRRYWLSWPGKLSRHGHRCDVLEVGIAGRAIYALILVTSAPYEEAS